MLTTVSVRAILLEQIERTRQSSKADIERFIEESERKIISLELQIGLLRVKLQRFRPLVELQDRERACIESLRYIIAPIRTLPIELLVEIFRHAIRQHVNDSFRDAHRITQVCSHWRKVAHAAPRLWIGPIWVDLSDGRRQLYVDGCMEQPLTLVHWKFFSGLPPDCTLCVVAVVSLFRSSADWRRAG
ncbi:F-box domain-containing protein [Mycena sanguinolenta]|uniref:F-box domain-containing protein n=1 Tax=Mycena sanguinolenta TaxID=230812 RepID=A0A8H6YFV8_9AGAR|nr:F-box domain-containing protein [Mycena sanguinolenta]